MRMSSVSAADDRPSAVGVGVGGGGYRDAESLFRTKPISEIRNVESATRKNIENKKEELRQLVGTRYRDLIDSADSISLMKSSCESISANISSIQNHIRSLSSSTAAETPTLASPNLARVGVYGIACRVKYLVDTPENIWGCLDESMFLEAAGRYVRAKHAQQRLIKLEGSGSGNGIAADVDQTKILANFPLLQHQWQIVESFKVQISQRSRERLLDQGLGIGAYVDALAAVSVVDELEPKQVLELFLDSRKTWILQKLNNFTGDPSYSDVVSVFCEVLSVIQVTVAQVGELFLQVLSDMPLFYKIILSTPPASQLFGGIPNPEEEVGLWKSFRDKLESVMVILDKKFIANTCLSWLRDCGGEIVSKVSRRHLIEAIGTGLELGSAEKLIRETMDSKEVLKDSLDWLKSVFGSEIELPWCRTRELVLEDDLDLWDEIFEKAFVHRMKSIIDARFEDLAETVSVADSVCSVGETTGGNINFQAYLNRPSTGGGVWFIESKTKKAGSILGNKSPPEDSDFQSCLAAYFGSEVSQIRDAVDRRCQSVLEDLLSFFESPKAAQRLKDLAPYVQNKCYDSVSAILADANKELEALYTAMRNKKDSDAIPPALIIEKALFMGRLLFALQSHSRHIPLILGSPRLWSKETMAAVSDRLASLLRQSRASLDSVVTAEGSGRQLQTGLRKQTSLATAALLGAEDKTNPKLEELNRTMHDLCTKAHTLWIQWLSDELSVILSCDLVRDEGLSATTSLRGWEETIVKQKQDESQSELKISLPSMPSLYIISFLCCASEEIHRIGGHVLDKSILQKFASSLLQKITIIYGDFLSAREANGPPISEKGVLQILLDLRFASDILSGGDTSIGEELSRSSMTRSSFRRKQNQRQTKSGMRGHVDGLISFVAQKLDPIDWLTYEPYLWENEKQSYLRHAVLFGFFVQLNRMYTDTVQKLPTNSESNIMRCSTVPRFKYLPISAPALSSRSTNKVSTPAVSDDASSRNPWKAYANGELSRKTDMEDSLSFSMASPFLNLKSFMEAGSKFGESTLKLGSMLTDGQVGIFKDRSAAAMSTFGDILPAQAAGLLSSFTAARSEQ